VTHGRPRGYKCFTEQITHGWTRQGTAADVLADRRLPFDAGRGPTIEATLTYSTTAYERRPTIHLHEILLELNDFEHRTTKVVSPMTEGFSGRFKSNRFGRVFQNGL
jgi:hypothetical protein